MTRTSFKSLFVPLLAMSLSVMTFSSGCNDEKAPPPQVPPKPKRPTQKMGALEYTILDQNIVGVVEENSTYSAFLFNGNADDATGGKRISLYFLKEGAVITEFHAAQDGRNAVVPRPIRQMLDFELAEYKYALEFFEANKKSIPGVNKADTALLKLIPVKSDSLKGGR